MKRTVLALALAVTAFSAQASDLKYNYIEGNYSSLDVGPEDLNGFSIDGSLKFNDSFYGFAGYQKNDQSGISLDEYTIGAGFRMNISGNTDWVSELSYVRDSGNLGNSTIEFDDNGYRIATGVRSMLGEKFELVGKVNYTDVSDFGDGFGVGVGGVYHFNDSFGLTAGYDYGDRSGTDLNSWNVGARLSF
jgi:long-subunit fatty acid transport protein